MDWNNSPDPKTQKSRRDCVEWGFSYQNRTFSCSLGKVWPNLYVDDLVIIGANLVGNRLSQDSTSHIIRYEGSGGPSLLPRDRSDPHPRRHTNQSKALCTEYVLQVWNDELQIYLDSSRSKCEASPRFWNNMQPVEKQAQQKHVMLIGK